MVAMRSISRPAERQPAGPRPILPNPITVGLEGVFYPNQNMIAPTSAASKSITSEGPGFTTSNSADMWVASRTAIASRFPTWTILVVLCGTSTNNPQGGVAFYSERPDDTQIVKLGMGDGQTNTAVLVVRDQQGNLAKHSGVTDVRTDSGKPRVVVGVRRSASNHALYVNGKIDAVNTLSSAGGTFGPTNAVIANDPNDTRSYLVGASVPLVLVWSRALTDAEIAIVSAKPWQVLQGQRLPVFAAPAAAAGATLTGGAACVVSAYGTLQSAIPLAGSAQASAVGAGALSTSIPLAGAAVAQAKVSGSLATSIKLAGAAVASASATGALAGSGASLAGAATVSASATGTLSTAISLAGTARAEATASGSLAGSGAGLSGAAIVEARASGALSTSINLAGAARAQASAAGALATQIRLAGGAVAVASAYGALATKIMLSGTASASASAAGALSTAPLKFDISKIHPSRISVFGGSGSRVALFEGSGSRVAVFDGSGSRVTRFQ